ADNRQLPAAVEQTRRVEFCLDSFVTQCRVAATEVNLVVRAHEMEVAEAEREPSTRVRAVEKGMPLRHSAREDGFELIQQCFELVRHVRLEVFRFCRLLLLYGSRARRRFRLLRADRCRRSNSQGDDRDQYRDSTVMHGVTVRCLRAPIPEVSPAETRGR